MPLCKDCGASVREGDAFCPSCGARQAAQQALGDPPNSSLPTHVDHAASLMTNAQQPPVAPLASTALPATRPDSPAEAPSGQFVAPQFAGEVPSLSNYNTITNTINMAPPAIVMNMKSTGTPLIVRAIWWFFIGWWLSAIFAIVGWTFMATIIFMPLGIWFIHRIPQAQTLRPRTRSFHTEFKDGAIVFTETTIPQHPWYVRLFYMVFCGLWIGLPWIFLGWFLGLTLILLPLSIWMLDRAPAVTTLQRH